jgi:hypothetical protein
MGGAFLFAIAAVLLLAGAAEASGANVARNLLTEANITLVGSAAGDNAGASVAGAGDVNGDGVPDLLIGAPKASYSGRGESGAAYHLPSVAWCRGSRGRRSRRRAWRSVARTAHSGGSRRCAHACGVD